MLPSHPHEIVLPGLPYPHGYTVTVFLIGAFLSALRAVWVSLLPPERQPATFGFRHSVLVAIGFAAFGTFEGVVLPRYLASIVESDARRQCGTGGYTDPHAALYWRNRTQYWSRYAYRCPDGVIHTGTFPTIPM